MQFKVKNKLESHLEHTGNPGGWITKQNKKIT